MPAQDETPSTLTDEDIVKALAIELARNDRRDFYADERELERCAGFPVYRVPAKEFLIMWRKIREIDPIKFSIHLGDNSDA